eukprot:scaffold709_cov197-Cylindrotheca_fusiformis.AAC.4
MDHGRPTQLLGMKRSNRSLSDGASDSQLLRQHLTWTEKQGHILTAGGKANEYYSQDRGFPYQQSELPHHHLILGKTHEAFDKWRSSALPCALIAGAWNRSLFVGGWQHSTDQEETVYNIQTHNLFIDMRIPKTRNLTLVCPDATSVEDLDAQQLRIYARQHIFAGFSLLAREEERPVCTRHHCIDWNFVGYPRPRPNKWWIEVNPDGNAWKEHSYATDVYGQHYYFERWERLGTSDFPRLALRKASTEPRDGILVAINDHFNYVLERKRNDKKNPQETSLVDLVDAAVAAGDLTTARSYLSIEGGHGRVSTGWRLDCSISPWDEGKQLWKNDGDSNIQVQGDSIDSCHILWKGEKWEIYDCSFETVEELRNYLSASLDGPLSKI